MLKVYVDGSCEPCNPNGTASYGLVVYRDGAMIFQKAKIIGSGVGMSNNVAEYAGLLAFLNLRRGTEPVTFYSDSQMLIKQMSGEWKANKGLYISSYLKARELCEGQPFTFLWIPREQNEEADRLSKSVLLEAGITVNY